MAEEITTVNGTTSLPIKKATKKKSTKRGSKKVIKPKPVKAVRTYPLITLGKCLIVAQKIKELNGGNSWSPKEIGNAIKVRGTADLFYYTAASRDFGLTSGTSSAKEISLTEFGRELIYAPNPETEKALKLEAFLKIPIFKNVIEYYKGNNLPEMKYLGNTLEDKFKLHPDYHVEFSNIFNENCKYLNITQGVEIDNIATQIEQKHSPSSSSSITVGEPKKGTKTALKAFVIMPFTEKDKKRPDGFFNEVLKSLLVPAGTESGFKVNTANKQGSDVIQSTIVNDLLEADLVIADLTDHNPNVLFELGLRMHADKPIALIKTKDTGKVFDVDSMLRVYEYNQNLWPSTIEADLSSLIDHIKGAWNNRGSEQTYMKILKKGGS
jgi:hypothetical protein